MDSSVFSFASKTLENETPKTSKLEEKEPQSSTVSNNRGKGKGEDEDENEEKYDVFLFMKEGACKDTYIAWEHCVKQGFEKNEDVEDKWHELFLSLDECVIAHPKCLEPPVKTACWFMEAGECKDTFIALGDYFLKEANEEVDVIIDKCRELVHCYMSV
ncbi:hypothetical protein MKX01_028425 [Papaver californicum]|nr:hypothetical protein MKX01_028425 [Papaver californicum]